MNSTSVAAFLDAELASQCKWPLPASTKAVRTSNAASAQAMRMSSVEFAVWQAQLHLNAIGCRHVTDDYLLALRPQVASGPIPLHRLPAHTVAELRCSVALQRVSIGALHLLSSRYERVARTIYASSGAAVAAANCAQVSEQMTFELLEHSHHLGGSLLYYHERDEGGHVVARPTIWRLPAAPEIAEETPLFRACKAGLPRLARLLISHGAIPTGLQGEPTRQGERSD